MFRVKISPQVVITLQSALPRLFIAVILITFSYAIAGLIIDLSYLVLGVMSLLITTSGHIVDYSSPQLFTALLTGNGLLGIFLGLVLGLVLPLFLGGLLTLYIGAGWLGLGLSGVILLIAAIFLLVIALRIFWLQIMTLVRIVLLIIAGPLIILLGAVAPNTGGFSRWVRELIANVAIYPMIIIVVFLSHVFFWGFFTPDNFFINFLAQCEPINLLNPFCVVPASFQGRETIQLPGFGGFGPYLGFIIASGLLALVPSVGNIIRSAISGQPFNYGTAIGEVFGPIRTIGGLGAAGGIGYGGTYLTRPRGPLAGGTREDVTKEVVKTLSGWAARGFR